RPSNSNLPSEESTQRRIKMADTKSDDAGRSAFVKGIHVVRYQVKDVSRSVRFYTQRLGFKLEHQQLPAFASLSFGDAQILLSGPGASGSRPCSAARAHHQ